MSTTVWFDSARERFWLLPDGVDLPDGPLRIRALTGAAREVSPDALDPYALPRERARQAVVDELLGAARHAGRALGTVAHGLAGEATSHLPSDLSWADLESRLGPMTTWADPERAREIVASGADRVRDTARRASRTVARTRDVAASTARSARAIGKILIEHPELAETASRFAAALARSRRRDDDPDKR